MSTSCLTHIYENDQIICTIYRHSDGYASGHGIELATFLEGFTIVNGRSDYRGKIANGMGCLAAQIVAHFKKGPGQIYLRLPENKVGPEEYYYEVKLVLGQLFLAISDYTGEIIWKGIPEGVKKAIEEDRKI